MPNQAKTDNSITKEEKILHDAVDKALSACKKNPSHDNFRGYDAAKKTLDEFKRKKQGQQNPEEAQLNLPDALAYLKDQGWKIEKSKLYGEKAIIGYNTINNNITFKKSDLDKYARKFLHTIAEASNSGSSEEKIKWESKIAEQKFKDMEFEADIKKGLYVRRSEVEQMLAARAAFLKDNVGQGFIHSRASKIVEIVKGKNEHIPELIDYWLNQVEEVFDYYSKPMRFEVPSIALEEEEEEV